MIIVKSLAEYRSWRLSQTDKSIGFVPTMGALHIGHGSLLQQSVLDNELTVLSIYVNPTQFNNANDLAIYPDTLATDLEMAESLGVDLVLLPQYEDIYSDGFRYQLDETSFSHLLCGAHRPGHFTGVLTIVMKLLNIVKPLNAYFGEKDYQQFCLIRDMASAFFLDVNVQACSTVREKDGLAFSSRNLNLTAAERILAPSFYAALSTCVGDEEVSDKLTQAGFDVDFVVSHEGRRYGAASLGAVRLIDNVALTELKVKESETMALIIDEENK